MMQKATDALKKHKETIGMAAINLAVVLMAYGGFFREGFSGDSITQKIWPMVNIDAWVMNGRFLAFVTGWGLDRLGINPMEHYKAFYLLFVLLVAVSMTIIQRSLLPVFCDEGTGGLSWKRLGIGASLSLIHINGLFCESFMFPECFLIFGLSHLFCALALNALFLRHRKVIAAVCLLIAALFYQAPLIVTLIIALACSFMETVRSKGRFHSWFVETVLRTVYVVALILVTVRIGAWADRMRGGILSKQVSMNDPGFMFSELWRYFTLFLKSGMGLLPPVFLPAVAMLLPLVCVLLIRKPAIAPFAPSPKGLTLAGFIILTAGMLALSFSIVLGNGMAGVSARLLGGLYATQAMMLCVAFCLTDRVFHKRLLLGFGAFYLVIQIVFCNMIMTNHYISNEKDLAYTEMLYKQIRHYETENAQTVTKVAYMTDDVCYDSYEDVYYKFGEINTRCINRVGWILLSVVAEEHGRTFDQVEMDPAIAKEHFAGRDWKTFLPQEQMVFQGDTMYWCVY